LHPLKKKHELKFNYFDETFAIKLLNHLQVRSVIRRSYNTTNVAPTVKMFIDGKFVDSTTNDWIDLHDPATNELVTRVPKCTQDEMQAAVDSSKRAYKTWSQTSILTRQQVMLKLQNIIRANMGELAKNITKEQGKTLVDAEGDVLRGLRE
jgi:malonate-semialdehyde dehydrogenase (acetylating) / methylmalonate-semialdehyde dehydrogenase